MKTGNEAYRKTVEKVLHTLPDESISNDTGAFFFLIPLKVGNQSSEACMPFLLL